jgi:hypothetical protein
MYLKNLSFSFHSFLFFFSLGTRSKNSYQEVKKILQRRRKEDEKPHGQDEPAPAN